MTYKLLGQDFTLPDVFAKVTGTAKYAEDFRAEGMVFCRMLTSPMPHARVRSIDVSAALALPGVLGVLLPGEVHAGPGAESLPFSPMSPNSWVPRSWPSRRWMRRLRRMRST